MKPLVFILTLIIAVQAFAFVGLQKIAEREDEKALVYAMCNESRIYDTVSEDTCGDLLYRFGMDFICASANKNEDTKCQVEVL